MSNTSLRDGPGASLGYPFTNANDASACACLADIQIFLRRGDTRRVGVTVASPVSVDLTLIDIDSGLLLFNSDGLISRVMLVNELRLLQWETDDVIVCASFDVTAAAYVGSALTLCDRAVYTATRQIDSLVIQTTTGDVEVDPSNAIFRPGYNCELNAEYNSLTVSAVAGSGQGQYQDCLDELNTVRSIAKVRPSNYGNIQLSADDCLRISPELIRTADGFAVSPGRWYFHDDCEECCRCEEKAAVWSVAKDLQDKLAVMIERYQKLRDEYNRRVSNMQSGSDCTARPLLNADLITDVNNNMSLYVTLCNGTEERLNDVRFKVSPFIINTAQSQLLRRYRPTVSPEFFASSPGMITIPDMDDYFYSLHEAIRGKHRVNFVPSPSYSYVYSVGGKNHIKQPGTVDITHWEYNRGAYGVIRNPRTNIFDVLYDGGMEFEFQCLEPGDTRYIVIGVSAGIPDGEPVGELKSTNLAFLVYSTSHDEINICAKSGFGFGHVGTD